MSNAQIVAALSLINREIAAEEERHQALLAEAAASEKLIANMRGAAQSLGALISGSPAQRKGSVAKRETTGTRARKGIGRKVAGKTARINSKAVLVAITNSGKSGVKRSVLSRALANRRGEEPSRKALDQTLQSLLLEKRVRREGYRFVAVGDPTGEAVRAEFETLLNDQISGLEQKPVSDTSPALEEGSPTGQAQETEPTASLAPSVPRRRGRPRKPVSDDVVRARNEVAGVIVAAGETGCKMSAIRSQVEEMTGVLLSAVDARRAVHDLLQQGTIRRDGYRYIANPRRR